MNHPINTSFLLVLGMTFVSSIANACFFGSDINGDCEVPFLTYVPIVESVLSNRQHAIPDSYWTERNERIKAGGDDLSYPIPAPKIESGSQQERLDSEPPRIVNETGWGITSDNSGVEARAAD